MCVSTRACELPPGVGELQRLDLEYKFSQAPTGSRAAWTVAVLDVKTTFPADGVTALLW